MNHVEQAPRAMVQDGRLGDWPHVDKYLTEKIYVFFEFMVKKNIRRKFTRLYSMIYIGKHYDIAILTSKRRVLILSFSIASAIIIYFTVKKYLC